MAAQFELKKTANGEFLFNLKAGNGEIILTSERYQTKPGALNGIESVRNNAANAHRFEQREAAHSQPYFVLKAAYGEIIGHSKPYASGQGLENRQVPWSLCNYGGLWNCAKATTDTGRGLSSPAHLTQG